MVWAGVITGVIALLVSGIVAWKNHFSPFRVKVYCGNPRLEPCELELGGGRTVMRFAVILPLSFVNTGARDGILSDIVLIVRSPKNIWLFQPFFYAKYGMQTESVLGRKLTEDPSNEPFYPVHLLGKERIYRPIVFAPVLNEEFPFGDNPLLPGKYSFQVQTLEVVKKDYETKLVFDVDLNVEQISNLSTGSYLIPFMEEVKEKRQNLQAK